MADEALTYQEEPAGGSVYQPSDEEVSGALRREKHGSRVAQTAGTATEVGGRTAQVGGAAMQVGGKTMEVAGKGTQLVGRGVEKGGEGVTRAGAALSETGLGAIIGVPLAAVGVGLTGIGIGTQAVGKGVEKGGQATDKAGRATRQTGGRVAQRGKQIRQHSDQLGRTSSFLPGRQRRREEQDKRSLLGMITAAPGVDSRAQKAADKVLHAIGTPVRMASSWALKESWVNLLSSYGLTLIYIHAHVLGRLSLGTDFFCKLGNEGSWFGFSEMKGGSFGGISGGAGKSAGGDNASMAKFTAFIDKHFSKAKGVGEALLLMAIDLIILIVLIGVLLIISYLVAILIVGPAKFLADPINFTKELMTKGL